MQIALFARMTSLHQQLLVSEKMSLDKILNPHLNCNSIIIHNIVKLGINTLCAVLYPDLVKPLTCAVH